MTTQPTTYRIPTDDGPMPALLWGGEGERARPGIVVVQEIFGLSDYVRSRCQDLADLGYVVLAPDIYWRIGGGVVSEDEPDFMERAFGLMQATDWDLAVSDAAAAVRELGGMPHLAQVGVVGFCFGGGLAYAAVASLGADEAPAALVSYYGSALPQLVQAGVRVSVPSLHHFGTADDYIPMEQVETIREVVTEGGERDDVEFYLHDGAGHAFDNPLPMFHHAQASTDAWEQTEDFLARRLPLLPLTFS